METEHQNRLIEYAEKNIAPFTPATMDDKQVYAYLLEGYMDESEIEDEGILLLLELFTKESMESATEYLNTQRYSNDSYYPALYTFTVKTSDNPDQEETIAYCNKIKALCSRNDGWIKGKLYKPAARGVVGHVSLSFGLAQEEGNDPRLPLELDAAFGYESVSPMDQAQAALDAAFDAAFDRIDESTGLPNSISGLDPNDDDRELPYKVSIFRVDHANTISIEKNDRCILFDCGKGDSANKNVIDHITQNAKPTTIIFSHWHKDHYNLLFDIDKSRLKHVIYPSLPINKKAKVFKAAIAELDKLQKQGVVLTNLTSLGSFRNDFLKNYGYHNIYCFLGKNRPSPDPADNLGIIGYPRDDDDSGIILSIKSPIKQDLYATLPGDCSYYSWPDEYELNFTNTSKLVLPHHGGHILIQKNPNISRKKYRSYYVSSEPRPFDNRIDPNSETYHKDFIDMVMHTSNEYLVHTYSSVCAYFTI